MNSVVKKILLFDKTALVLTALSIALLVFNVTAYMYTIELEDANRDLAPELSKVRSLALEAKELKNIVTTKERKVALSKTAGVVPTLEKILTSLGLKAKTIKPLDKKKTEGIMEENADIEIAGTDLNSIVNLIYIIENSSDPIKINSASVRTEFENPEKFILNLSVSLMSKG